MRYVIAVIFLIWVGRLLWFGLAALWRAMFGPPAPRRRGQRFDFEIEGEPRGPHTTTQRTRRTRSQDESQLDPGGFGPAREETMRQARRIRNAYWNPWSMRQDLIPPATDDVTRVVDGAMVGEGFITPEELEEIHEVGREMDEKRPTMLHAQTAAVDAVRLDAEQRAAIRAQKKAEAAERKRKRAEEVKHRRATDIVFLGRGVSRGLADRRANVERLEAAGLPVLATPADVARALGLEIPRLRWLAFHNDAARRVHYVRFTVPKRSGGVRELASPHKTLRRAQEWILREVLDHVPVHDAAHGFVRGKSIATNAKVHVGRDVVVNADLRDFFPTVTFWRVEGAFRQLGYSAAVATIFALLCTEAPRTTLTYEGETYHAATGPRALPQGACTSPALSNLVARRLDSRMTGIAKKLGWLYTRYADDLTLSTSGAPKENVGYLLARLRHIAEDEGFEVNEKKTRVLRRNTRQEVTGLVVNDQVAVRRKEIRRLRAILHRAKTEGLAQQNREEHPNFEAWIKGMIAYVSMVQPKQGAELRRALDQI